MARPWGSARTLGELVALLVNDQRAAVPFVELPIRLGKSRTTVRISALMGEKLGALNIQRPRRGDVQTWTVSLPARQVFEATVARKRRWSGMAVNGRIPEPSAPGGWVDAQRCYGCGAFYSDHRAGSWGEAYDLVVAASESQQGHNGFKSDGAIRWAWRCIKLADWYMKHHGCGPAVPCEGCITVCEWCQLGDDPPRETGDTP